MDADETFCAATNKVFFGFTAASVHFAYPGVVIKSASGSFLFAAPLCPLAHQWNVGTPAV